MTVIYEERLSDSPFVQTIWHTNAVQDGNDIVSADTNWDLLVIKKDGRTRLSVSGPMTKAVPIPHTEGEEYIGIRFKLGTCMPYFPANQMVNVVTTLPEAASTSFWLSGAAWQFPDYENVDAFLDRLARADLLVYDPIVDAALQGYAKHMSPRSVQRHFLRTTGLTQRYIRYIERARQAAALLQQGVSILDTVYETGYADQPHLTKALKRLIGQTPAQIALLSEPR